MSRRVVFDTSTLVSAALRDGSVPQQAVLQALASCDICAAEDTLDELHRVMTNRKFDRYLDAASRSAFVAMMRRNSQCCALTGPDIASVDPPCRDPKDDKFLALARVAEADLIVSSDKDLLVLTPWRGIPILTPAQFLAAAEE